MTLRSRHFAGRAVTGALAAFVVVAATLVTAESAAAAGQSTLWVSVSGTDTLSCGPSASPCLTITQAIANADSIATINVGPGVFDGFDWTAASGDQLTIIGSTAATTIDTPVNSSIGHLVLRRMHFTTNFTAVTVFTGRVDVSNSDFVGNYVGFEVVGGTGSVTTSRFTTSYYGALALDAPLSVTNSTFTQNFVNGISSSTSIAGSLAVAGSTFDRNGAAIQVNGGPATISNSTFSANAWGLYTLGGTTALSSSTFVRNSIDINRQAGAVAVASSALFGTTACTTPVTDAGYNDEAARTCGLTTATSHAGLGSVQFAPLGSYGGPSATAPPISSAQIVDRIPVSSGQCPSKDQRGVTRPQGTACDVGAVELAASTTSITLTPAQPKNGKPVTLKATVTSAVTSPALPAPRGTVVFKVSTITLCTATLTAAGTGSCTVTARGTGSTVVTAKYTSTNGFHPSTRRVTVHLVA